MKLRNKRMIKTSTVIPYKSRLQPQYKKNLCLCIIIILYSFLSGCSLLPSKSSTVDPLNQTQVSLQTQLERNQQMRLLLEWEITGKIAFLNEKKRQSANLFWQHKNNEQRLNLTTYLGINVMELKSKNNVYTIEVSDKTYQSDNLDTLIYQLTGFKLPTKALSYWLKGLTYLDSDEITFDPITHLPQQLTSFFNLQAWQIYYQQYKLFNQHQLATKITIKQDDLTIKIAIKDWTL